MNSCPGTLSQNTAKESFIRRQCLLFTLFPVFSQSHDLENLYKFFPLFQVEQSPDDDTTKAGFPNFPYVDIVSRLEIYPI
jgi:hypothetical protein